MSAADETILGPSSQSLALVFAAFGYGGRITVDSCAVHGTTLTIHQPRNSSHSWMDRFALNAQPLNAGRPGQNVPCPRSSPMLTSVALRRAWNPRSGRLSVEG